MSAHAEKPAATPPLHLLSEIRRAIAAGASTEQADEILFRLGRSWGESVATPRDGDGAAVQAELERAARHLVDAGLGRAVVETCVLDRGARECAIGGRITGETAAGSPSEDGDGTACTLAAGFLTGASAKLTGLDLVCSTFDCVRDCNSCSRAFEIRPAHAASAVHTTERAVAGSARFFLNALGGSLGEGEISLGDLVERTSDAVLLIDSSDIIRYWNRGAEETFLYRREEVVGRRIGFLLPPDLHAQDELGSIKAYLERHGALSNFITRRIRKDGVELWISLTRTLLHDHAGRAIGSTAILRDITPQRRAEAELQEAKKLAIIGELSAKIAHEIKNPLAGIYAAIQLLERSLAPQDERRGVFADVGREIHRLDETVQDLLRFARPNPAKLLGTPVASFVRDLIEQHRLQPELQTHRIEIEVPEGLLAPIDARLMSQALMNLVLNAGQAMSAGGTIRIAARESDGQLEIEVADTGVGVPSEIRAKIFDPFFTTKSRGTGLGLAIARKNVEAHGGTLAVADRPGGGAVFRMRLPISHAAIPPP